MLFETELALLGCAVVALLILAQKTRSKKALYPPGPPGLPIIGNVHQLPLENQEYKFQEWGLEYGDIVYIRMFGRPVIIVNSVEVARELMEKRGANYSDRPPLTMMVEMLGWDITLPNFRWGDSRLRKHRKWIHDSFQTKEALHGYRHIQHREACTLLLGLLSTPEAFDAHLKRYVGAMLTDIAYGYRVHTLDDEILALADKATTETVRAGSPASNILAVVIEFFPALRHYPRWWPGSGFRVKTDEIRNNVKRMHDIPYNMVKERAASGKAIPCFAATLLEEHLVKNTLTEEEENDIKGAAGVLYAAGSDTSLSVMNSFLLAMVRNPEVLKKAQEEIDKVIGTERLPDPDDKDSLPYLNCVIKETLRWATPVPLGVPHQSIQVDIFRGYEIPGGSMILPNVWGMLHDPRVYPEPERFIPERFEGLDKTRADEMDPSDLVFGFGRRLAMSREATYRDDSLAYGCLRCRDDEHHPVKAADGKVVIPPADYHYGFVVHPKHFECTIRPRNEMAAQLIKQTSAFS